MSFSLSRVSTLWGQRLILLILLVCLVVLLWWPQGLNIPPTEDDWILYALLDNQAVTSINDLTIINQWRPLISLWWQIAYNITPDSMLSVSWFTALMLVVRGVSFYVIVSYLTRHRGWAAAAACLIVVIPLDFAVYEKGTFHIQITTSLYFMATALFLTHSRRFRPMHLTLIGVLLALACSMYESAYPMIAVTPLLLVLKERRFTRRIALLSLAWWTVPAICAAVFFIPSLVATTSYQSRMLSSTTAPGILRTTFDAYVHVFAKSWYGALRKEPGDFLLLRALFGIVVTFYVWMMTRSERDKALRIPIWLILPTSILLIGAGFAMYLPTPLITGGSGPRVHFLTTGGASLLAVTACWLVGYLLRIRLLFPLLIGVLVTIGLGGTMNTIRQGTVTRAYEQGYFLSSLITQAPQIQSDTTLVFIFTPDVDNPFPDFYVAYLQNAVTYLYRDYSFTIRVCYDSNCSLEVWQQLNPSQTLVFRVLPSLDLELIASVPELDTAYNPQSRIDITAPRPPRWYKLYSQIID